MVVSAGRLPAGVRALALLPCLGLAAANVKFTERQCYDHTTAVTASSGHANTICFYGHCLGNCKTCTAECVAGQGSCWMRANNDTEAYGVPVRNRSSAHQCPHTCAGIPMHCCALPPSSTPILYANALRASLVPRQRRWTKVGGAKGSACPAPIAARTPKKTTLSQTSSSPHS